MRSYVYRYAGLLEEALEDCDTALAFDPRERGLRSCALAFAQNNETQRARDFINLDGGSGWASDVLSTLNLREGDLEQARQNSGSATRTGEGTDVILEDCHTSSEEAAEVARQIEISMREIPDPEPTYWRSAILAYCGHHEVAMGMLRHAVEENYCSYPAIDRDPLWADLREDPKFLEIRDEAMACRQSFLDFVESRGN